MLTKRRLRKRWRMLWLSFGSQSRFGKIAARLASWGIGPLYAGVQLADLHPNGFVSPRARLAHERLKLGFNCFLGDQVLIYQDGADSSIEFGDRVHIHEQTILQTGDKVNISIGADTHIQTGCQFSAYMADIVVGRGVEMAPRCALYSYNHAMDPDRPIRQQPLISRGAIRIEDDAWLGYGVVVLDGVTIGAGAVVAAGSVVSNNIPANAIAGGIPARVIRSREHERSEEAATKSVSKADPEKSEVSGKD